MDEMKSDRRQMLIYVPNGKAKNPPPSFWAYRRVLGKMEAAGVTSQNPGLFPVILKGTRV